MVCILLWCNNLIITSGLSFVLFYFFFGLLTLWSHDGHMCPFLAGNRRDMCPFLAGNRKDKWPFSTGHRMDIWAIFSRPWLRGTCGHSQHATRGNMWAFLTILGNDMCVYSSQTTRMTYFSILSGPEDGHVSILCKLHERHNVHFKQALWKTCTVHIYFQHAAGRTCFIIYFYMFFCFFF